MCYHFFVNKFFSESGDKMENINVIEQKNNVIDINTSIENMIFEIRGAQVMLSSDVAKFIKQKPEESMRLSKEILKDFLILFAFN